MIKYFLIVYAVTALAASIALYVLHGVGLSTMLRRSGLKSRGLPSYRSAASLRSVALQTSAVIYYHRKREGTSYCVLQ